MANPWAGEVELVIDGRRQVLRLTLGALAELEADLGAETLFNLIERFETGNVRARDVLALIAAGLRGGGWSGRSSDLVAAEIEGGAVEAARVAGQLLVRAFEMPKPG